MWLQLKIFFPVHVLLLTLSSCHTVDVFITSRRGLIPPPPMMNRFVRRFCSHSDFGRVVKNVDNVSQLIKSQLSKAPVVLYMKGSPQAPQCGFSWKAVQALEACGANYAAHDVLLDMRLREGIKAYSQWPTIPQVYIDGQFVGGSDIVTDMAKSGELKKALEGAKATREA